MPFSLPHSLEILQRTPHVLRDLLDGLSDHWLMTNEGGESWSPYDVVGHLANLEATDWRARIDVILADGGTRTFASVNRTSMFETSKGKTITTLLDEFAANRSKNLTYVQTLTLNETILARTGIHPVFGEVTLRQLLSTWTAHDLTHLNQISRVMAHQYRADVGPWVEFLGVLRRPV